MLGSSLPHGFTWRPPEDVRVDCQPPILVDTLRRSPFALVQALEQFRVETSTRYAADVTGPQGAPDGKPEPWCNLFVRDWLKAMGVDVPRLRANELVLWLQNGPGWKEASSPSVATQLASKLGWPVVVGWSNPDASKSGHVAALRPPPRGGDESVTWVAQAGRVRSSCLPLVRAFRGLPVRYFVHE